MKAILPYRSPEIRLPQTITLGACLGGDPMRLWPVIHSFEASHPHCTVALTLTSEAEATAQLLSRRIDVAVVFRAAAADGRESMLCARLSGGPGELETAALVAQLTAAGRG